MARTTIAAFVPPSGDDPALPLIAGSAKIPMVAVDTVNSHRVVLTGREVLVFFGGAAGGTITITSAADEEGRTGDITAYALAANDIVVLGPFPFEGWAQAGDGNALWFTASVATILVGALRLPPMV